MPKNVLPPIPPVSGRYLNTGRPMPLKLRLQYMAAALDARVTSHTVVAVVPSPFRRAAVEHGYGLSRSMTLGDARLQEERECYQEIATAVMLLHKCMRAPELDKWYGINSLLMRMCFYVAIQFILGHERFGVYRARIALQWLRIPYPGRFIAVMMSRQVGKTGILSIVAALLMMLAKSTDATAGIAFYAQGAGLSETTMRIAVNLIRVVYRMIEGDPLLRDCLRNRILSHSHQSVTIEMPADFDRIVFQAVAKPGRLDNVRGSRENFLFGDELLFMPREMLTGHLLPIMTGNRFGIFMTTPGTSAEQGMEIFNTWLENPANFPYGTCLQLSLVCPSCYVKPNATRCRHNLSYMPPWRDLASLLTAIRNAPSAVERERLEREMLGFVEKRIGAVLEMDVIHNLCVMADAQVDLKTLSHRVLYLVVDPCIGSVSNVALYSVLMYHGRYVIIGAEDASLLNCGKDEFDMIIRAHFVALKEQYSGLFKDDVPPNERILVCPLLESNGSPSTVADISRLLRTDSFPVHVELDEHGLLQTKLRGGRNASFGGVYTDEKSKEAGVSGVIDLVRNRRILFDHRFATSRVRAFRSGTQHRVSLDLRYVRRTRADNGEPVSKMMQPPTHYEPELDASLAEARGRIMQTLARQLTALVRTPSGISGKGASKRERDDLATALLQLVCFVTRMLGSTVQMRDLRKL